MRSRRRSNLRETVNGIGFEPCETVTSLLHGEQVVERRMFGGVGYLIRGHMVCGVHGENLIALVGAAQYINALKEPGAHPFDMTGRPMVGWMEIAGSELEDESAITRWMQMAVNYCQTLPPK